MSSSPSPNAISAHIAIRPDWLGKRREAALEPDLPIVDPHHHLIDRPESGTYLLPDLLKDIADGGHNVVATVYLEWLSMYRADGPVEMRPVGEIEFANGVAAMSASGGYGKPRVCAGIVGHADLTLGARVRDVLEAMIGLGGGRFRGIRFISASHPDQASGAPRPSGRRAGCATARYAKASPSWRRLASASTPSCTTRSLPTCSTSPAPFPPRRS